MEVPLRVCQFNVKVSGDAIVIVEHDSDVLEVSGCGGGFVDKFDDGMPVV